MRLQVLLDDVEVGAGSLLRAWSAWASQRCCRRSNLESAVEFSAVTDGAACSEWASANVILVNRLPTLTPVLPHLRMLLSLDRYRADGRPVRGFVNTRGIGRAGGVAECPSHAASPPVLGSPAGAAAVCRMIVSAALRLSDRNKRCTMVCCGGPNCSEQRSARRPRIASAVRRGSVASQRSMSARCGSSIDGIFMRFLYGLRIRRWMMRCSPRCISLPSPFANAAAFVVGAGGLAVAASLPARAPTRVPSSAWASLISASRATGSSVR